MDRGIIVRLAALPAVAVALAALPGPAAAGPFTGPTSPYYLDNFDQNTIYVVQGTTVINQFPFAYGFRSSEGTLAVTNVVSTKGSMSYEPGTAGQYTLGGTPTGVSWLSGITLANRTSSVTYDGTSDGRYNYTVEYSGRPIAGGSTEDVIRFDQNWQNPTSLFSVQSRPGAGAEWLGIAYDPRNNSLWVSGWGMTTINDYSLSGTLLSSFNTDHCCSAALGFDPADGTLWLSYFETNQLEQWSTGGVLLQSGSPGGLPGGYYLSGDFPEAAASIPEPSSVSLLGGAVIALGVAAWRRQRRADHGDVDIALAL